MTHSEDYLNYSSHEDAPAIYQRKGFIKKIIISAIIFIGALLVFVVLATSSVVALVLDGIDKVEAAQASTLELDFQASRDNLSEAEVYFSRARNGIRVFHLVTFLPVIGNQLDAAEDLLQTSVQISGGLSNVMDVLEDIYEVVYESQEASGQIGTDYETIANFVDLSEDEKHEILLRFHDALPKLELAKAKIDLAIHSFEKIDQEEIFGPLKEAITPLGEELPKLKNELDILIPIASVIPELAGLDTQKNYMILLLNNAEMRPGGGFIGTYGILSVRNGEIIDLYTKDVYAVDGPSESFHQEVPPGALQKYLGVSAWYMRDANWWPDYPTSVTKVLELFRLETTGQPSDGQVIQQQYVPIDGVIAITPTFGSRVLELVGPITVDDQTFTPENLLETLEYQVEYGFAEDGTPYHQRKEIIGKLVDEVKNRLFAMDVGGWESLFDIASQSIEEKHLMAYSTDMDVQEVFSNESWSSEIDPGIGDYLMVVDANMASLKTDPAVERTINYDFDRNEDGEVITRVEIDYNHTGDFDWNTSRLRTYTRIYVPYGSELIDHSGSLVNDKLKNPSLAEGTVDIGSEFGLTVFGAFTSIEPGEQRTLMFEYKLPDWLEAVIDKGEYNLRVQKQPGAADHRLTLGLDFDTKIQSAEPAEDWKNFDDDRYDVDTILRTDLDFVVELD